MADGAGDAAEIVDAEGLAQVSGSDALAEWIDGVLRDNPDEVARYQDGEQRLLGFFMGQVMKRSGGRADPQRVKELLGVALDG